MQGHVSLCFCVCDCAPLLVVISLLVDLGFPIYTILGLVKLNSDIVLLLLLSCQTKSYRNFCLIRVCSGTKFLLSFTLFIYFNLKI